MTLREERAHRQRRLGAILVTEGDLRDTRIAGRVVLHGVCAAEYERHAKAMKA